MKWAEKQRRWAWRQLRLMRTAVDAALTADPSTVDAPQVVDHVFDIAMLGGSTEAEMERQLAAWEQAGAASDEKER